MSLGIPELQYYQPTDVKGACALLRKLGNRARVLAGGTDLLVDLKQKSAVAEHIVDITAIPDLGKIEEDRGVLSIGALATHSQIAENRLVADHLPALCDAARSIAAQQVRNVGTIGGNIVSAVPSADLPPVLIAAEASVMLHNGRRERACQLHEFFTGPRSCLCGQDEVLTRVVIPPQPPNSGSAYHKFALRNANALAVAGVVARLVLSNGRVKEARIVLGAVAPSPMLAGKASGYLAGKEPTEEAFAEAGKISREECQPISDIRGSAEFRRELVEVLTRRALADALSRATAKK